MAYGSSSFGNLCSVCRLQVCRDRYVVCAMCKVINHYKCAGFDDHGPANLNIQTRYSWECKKCQNSVHPHPSNIVDPIEDIHRRHVASEKQLYCEMRIMMRKMRLCHDEMLNDLEEIHNITKEAIDAFQTFESHEYEEIDQYRKKPEKEEIYNTTKRAIDAFNAFESHVYEEIDQYRKQPETEEIHNMTKEAIDAFNPFESHIYEEIDQYRKQPENEEASNRAEDDLQQKKREKAEVQFYAKV